MMAQRRSLIYLCKRNVPLSNSSLCNCNKRTIIESLSWSSSSLPVGRICNRSDDIMRWFSRGSYRCYDPSFILPSHSNHASNCEVPRKSLSSVSTKHNLQSQSRNKSTEAKNPKKIKQAAKIKSLHKENKSLFGDLLETKVDKVKRTRKELKENPAKPLLHSKKRNDNLQGKEDLLKGREESCVVDTAYNDSPSESLPKQGSVRLEHAGTLINKNRKVHVLHDTMDKLSEGRSKGVSAHKGAEIKWALRNAPSRTKLIELSPSSSRDAVVDRYEEGHIVAGDSSSAIEIDRAYVGKQKREPNNPLSEPLSSESLPTVEQLINSFYETDDGQLWPRSESRKILLTDSTAAESMADSFSSQSETEHISTIIEDTAGDHYDQKKKTMSPNPKPNDSNQIAGRDSTNRSKPQPQRNNSKNYPTTSTGPDASIFALPYYNPERNVTGEFKMYEDESRSMNLSENCDDHDNQRTAKSIISFPFPYSKNAWKKGTDFGGGSTNSAQHSQSQDDHSLSSATSVADGIVESDNRNDNKLIMRSESLSHEQQRQPLVLTSSKVPSVSKILNATMPEEQAKALKRWEQKMIAQMGEQGFRQYKESILTNGKALHRNIETYLRGPSDEIPVAEANQGHWSSLSGILASVEHVHVLESHVIHPKLQYCGVIDCVAEFRNRLVLIDWKTSQKPKPLVSMTYDTPLQIAAYIGAINYDPKYSLKIDDGLIVVAYEDGSSCQTFLLSQLDVGKYWKLWLKRLQLFRRLAPPV